MLTFLIIADVILVILIVITVLLSKYKLLVIATVIWLVCALLTAKVYFTNYVTEKALSEIDMSPEPIAGELSDTFTEHTKVDGGTIVGYEDYGDGNVPLVVADYNPNALPTQEELIEINKLFQDKYGEDAHDIEIIESNQVDQGYYYYFTVPYTNRLYYVQNSFSNILVTCYISKYTGIAQSTNLYYKVNISDTKARQIEEALTAAGKTSKVYYVVSIANDVAEVVSTDGEHHEI